MCLSVQSVISHPCSNLYHRALYTRADVRWRAERSLMLYIGVCRAEGRVSINRIWRGGMKVWIPSIARGPWCLCRYFLQVLLQEKRFETVIYTLHTGRFNYLLSSCITHNYLLVMEWIGNLCIDSSVSVLKFREPA